MKAKIYLFRLAVALVAFAIGICVYSARQYFQPKFQPPKQFNLPELPKVKQLNPICPFDKVKTPEETQPTEKPAEPKFDDGGDYYMIGKLPKGFEDFDQLSISTSEYKPNADGTYEAISTNPEGSFITKKNYKLSQIIIRNKDISFTTESIKGISYQFRGRFLEEKDFQTIKDETIVLKGRLIKMQNGKNIAQSNVRFGYLDCC